MMTKMVIVAKMIDTDSAGEARGRGKGRGRVPGVGTGGESLKTDVNEHLGRGAATFVTTADDAAGMRE